MWYTILKVRLGRWTVRAQDPKREEAWVIKVAVVGLAGREKCIRQLARNARKSAKFLSSPEKTVRFIAGTVFPSVKTKAVKIHR